MESQENSETDGTEPADEPSAAADPASASPPPSHPSESALEPEPSFVLESPESKASAPPVAASEMEEPPASLPAPPPPRRTEGFWEARARRYAALFRGIASYFLYEPTFLVVLGPYMLLSTVLYSRIPTTNYIFDEQEALLANPYVNQVGFKYEDAIYRDFWGLPPNGSIGSYRPIPNYLWRGVVELGQRLQNPFDLAIGHLHVTMAIAAAVVVGIVAFLGRRLSLRRFLVMLAVAAVATGVGISFLWFVKLPPIDPLTTVGTRSFFQHIYNLLLHGVNAALVTAIAWRYSRRRFFAWMAGLTFVTAAILTEAVCGCVGIADVLGGMGALLALAALGMRGYAMPFAVFLATLLGLFSKESAVVCVPLIPFAALLSAPVVHPERPARVARMLLAAAGTVAAFVLYVEMRKLWFPSPLSSDLSEELPPFASRTQVLIHDFMVWFHQPPLPHDPLNNPLADPMTGPDYRLAGALRVYERGLGQTVFPWTLSGDYSSPQEPVPDKLVFFGSVWGAILTLVPLGGAIALFVVGLRREIVGPRVLIERFADPVIGNERIGFRTVFWIMGVFFFALLAMPILGLKAPLVPVIFGSSLVGTAASFRKLRPWMFEAFLVVLSVLLVRRMLSLPPAPHPDSADAMQIAISVDQMKRYGKLGATAVFVVGALVEIFWRVKKQSRDLWAVSAVAIGLMWLVISYFPHSNIPALLPTVRAERLWYFPVLGTTMVIATALYFATKTLRTRGWKFGAVAVPVMFIGFQGFRAEHHATDYRDDLEFWGATKDAVPNSSKAHLNYSVMVGARGDMPTRLIHSKRAMELAPDWAMAHIYTGDTLCRMHRSEEAWPYYASGFDKGPNDKGLISLALQCLWDERSPAGVGEHALKLHDAELRQIAYDHPGSWIAYLATDTLDNGEKNNGVDPQYRPRSYNEGPKKSTASGSSSTDSSSTDNVAEEGLSFETDDLEQVGASASASMSNAITKPAASGESTSPSASASATTSATASGTASGDVP